MSTLPLTTPSLLGRASNLAAILGLAAAVPLAGCTDVAGDSDEPEGEVRATEQAVQSAVYPSVASAITGAGQSRTQSETAAAVTNYNGQQIVMVAYNDDTDTEPNITFTETTRTTCTGATLAGYSYSTNAGTTWTKGAKLAPPSGWSILWGDPAATASTKNPRYVYFTNLAAPTSKWPASGCFEGSFSAGATPLGGACIARSTDGGKTFGFGAQACVTNQNHFYDGASMATAPNGAVYAAFLDVDASRIDVWKATSETASFTLIASNPFPGYVMASHPRIKVGADNKLILVAQDQYGALRLTRWNGSVWDSPIFMGTAALYPTVTLSSPTDPSIDIRTGPQFSFDIGAPSAAGGDAIRILYAYENWHMNNDLQLEVSHCAADLTSCGWHQIGASSGWHYPPTGWPANTGDVFNPSIAYSGGKWKISFLSREMYLFGTNQIALLGADLRVGSGNVESLGNIAQISYTEQPCSDLRGYWGDYDHMVPLGFDAASGKERFLRPMSDSTSGYGACTRWQYTSTPLHLASLRFF